MAAVAVVNIKMAGKEQFRAQPRLPKFAAPKRYNIILKPDLSIFTFRGVIHADIEVLNPTNFLVLNVAELKVLDFSFLSHSSHDSPQEILPESLEIFEDDEILVAEFNGVLPLGAGLLRITYEGILNDKMKGFYRSIYDLNGEKKIMAVTQFEPVDARRCFPCWDEPALKAKFKIELELPFEVTALSNMPVENDEKLEDNLRKISFQETPIMSTYLVAVVIGLFDYVEDFTSDGISVRVYCQAGRASQGKFALNVAVKTLDLYKKYFDVPYALPKLDMVAIPDFSAGAMENYGLVTYRETALLYDDQNSAAANKQRVGTVVAHELAHQWFGNLVTMEWWTHLWLNEGFATWMSYLAMDSLFPEWKIWTQFSDETTGGLRLDGLEESHPIEVEINHALEVDEIFDAISYKKGASVIRMLENYLGSECFQRALASYIKKHAYGNAKTEDLWTALEEESGEPVKDIMNTWTKQKGYPVLSVQEKDNKLVFEQTQFLLGGSHGHGHWIIPITYCHDTYDGPKHFLLREKTLSIDTKEFLSSSISTDGQKNAEDGKQYTWIKFNVDQSGFYRVKYDENLSAGLRYATESKCLSATDRFAILDDSFALSMACQQSLDALLRLMHAYRETQDYSVVSSMISISYEVTRIVSDATPKLLESLKKLFIDIFLHSSKRLGWDPLQGENHLDSMLRGELLTALAVYGHEETITEARKRFIAFLEDRTTILLPPDLRKAVYVAVMQNVSWANKSDYLALLNVYRESDLSQEKTRILGSLASCPDPDIIRELLSFLLSKEVRSQDAVFGLAVSLRGREIAWEWLKVNWDKIYEMYGSGFLLTSFVKATASQFASHAMASEVEAFFASRNKASIARTVRQSIERVNINARWVQSVRGEEKHLAEVLSPTFH